MNTIKELFYFDNSTIYNHKGGAGGETNDVQNNLKHVDEKELSAGMLEFWNDIVEIAKDNFKRVYNIFIGWVLTPIIFGSFAPALPLEEVFDPTGAGDSFAGGFIGYLAKTNDVSFENMKRAVINGSAMASFCVEKFGTQKLTEINQNDVDSRINEFVNLVQFDVSLK